MRKIIKAFTLLGLSLVLLLCSFGCSKEEEWEGTSLKDWGNVYTDTVGGAVVETQNYLYFINGKGEYTDDNTFGTPVKGALMAIDKADFATGAFGKAEVVVPKLFTSKDYGAGLYIFGDYVYYGTPNLDKNSSGKIANEEMVFSKTKLDGTESEKLFVVSGHEIEFRIFADGEDVYVVYYDITDTTLKVYGVSEDKIVASFATNDKTNEEGYESLKAYSFGKDAVYFTTTVYSEKYYEEAAKSSTYARKTESYNRLYVIDADNACGKCLLDGSEKEITYEIKNINNGYVFYTATPVSGSAKTYELTEDVEIKNTSYIADTTYIAGLDEIYVVSGNNIVKTTFTADEKSIKETVVLTDSLSSVLYKDGDFVYYLDSASKIVRKEMCKEDARLEQVSDSVVDASWYKPEIMTIDGQPYLFYGDANIAVNSYIKVVKLNSTVIERDSDDDGEKDTFVLENEIFGKLLAVDEAGIFNTQVSNLNGTEIKYKVDGAILTFKDVDRVEAIYKGLSEEAKSLVDGEYMQYFENIKDAKELSKLYYKLEGIVKADADTDSYESAYKAAKAKVDELKENGNYVAVRDMVNTNLKACYQKAVSVFEK